MTAFFAFVKFIRAHLVAWVGEGNSCDKGKDFHFQTLVLLTLVRTLTLYNCERCDFRKKNIE